MPSWSLTTWLACWGLFMSLLQPVVYTYVIDRSSYFGTAVCDCSNYTLNQIDACKSQCVVSRVKRQKRKRKQRVTTQPPPTTIPTTTIPTTSTATTTIPTTRTTSLKTTPSISVSTSYMNGGWNMYSSTTSSMSTSLVSPEMGAGSVSTSSASGSFSGASSSSGSASTSRAPSSIITTEKITTAIPTTTVKETTKPTTTVKETTKPITTVKETTKPVTTVKETTKPATTVKETTKPTTTVKETIKAITVKVTTKPVTTVNEMTKPVTTVKPAQTKTTAKTSETAHETGESSATSTETASGNNMVVTTKGSGSYSTEGSSSGGSSQTTPSVSDPGGTDTATSVLTSTVTESETASLTSGGSGTASLQSFSASSVSGSSYSAGTATGLPSASSVSASSVSGSSVSGSSVSASSVSGSSASAGTGTSTSVTAASWSTNTTDSTTTVQLSTEQPNTGSTTLYQSTAVHSEAYNPDGDNTKVMIQGSATTKNPAHAREDAKYPGLIKESDYVFNDLKGRMKDDQLLCKNEYGVVRKILNPDSDGEVNYNLFCFKYTDLEESNVEPDDYVITVRIEKLKPELWWTSVDQILRGMLMVKLRDLLSNHRFFSGLKNWEDGPFQVLYMEDTPMLVDYVSQIGVIVIVIDDMIIPGKLVKPILDEIMREQYKNSSPFGYGVMFYLYLGIPERYMSTLVWSHNEFLASILACVTLGSIILMVMVSALIAGVRSGGDADSEDGNEEEEDDNTDVNENSVAGDDEAEGAESNLKSGADNQSENNLDSGEVEGCCCDITPDKADVIVNKFNITATGEEEARTEAEAANTAAALAAETSSANLDQEDTKKTEIEKKCNLEGDDLPPPITEKEQEEGKVVDPDVCSESETDNTGKECGEVDQAEDVKIVNTEVGREEVVEDVSTGEGAPEKEVKELNN
ncbi:hypothetical protein ACHWQZ_G010934 [Mnemiopsis leidyi]